MSNMCHFTIVRHQGKELWACPQLHVEARRSSFLVCYTSPSLGDSKILEYHHIFQTATCKRMPRISTILDRERYTMQRDQHRWGWRNKLGWVVRYLQSRCFRCRKSVAVPHLGWGTTLPPLVPSTINQVAAAIYSRVNYKKGMVTKDSQKNNMVLPFSRAIPPTRDNDQWNAFLGSQLFFQGIACLNHFNWMRIGFIPSHVMVFVLYGFSQQFIRGMHEFIIHRNTWNSNASFREGI